MTFSEACCLKNHWRTNLGEKTFPCKECPKAFSQGGQLKIHFTKHSGEKPYRSVNVKVTFQTIKFLSFSDKLAHLQTKMECLIICVVYLGFYISIFSHLLRRHFDIDWRVWFLTWVKKYMFLLTCIKTGPELSLL